MSNRSASPLPVKPPNDAFLPALKIARRAHPRPLISFASEQIPPVCESCSRLTLFTDRLLKLHDRMKEKNLEFERIIQRKTELLGIAAHDLRLPLASIHTCSELLAEGLDGGASAEQIEWIESIHSVSEFMLRLLNDTLDFAMVESGTLQLRAAPGFLAAILAQSVSMSFPLAARKQTGITLIQEGEPQPVLLDPLKMIKVFNNLIENAIKYCQPGARIEARISRGEDSVLVAVQDDGPGIGPADLKTLFTPFQRTRARALSEEPSAGLGLAIAKDIVDLHGGRIWVKSEVGKGTTFYVSLPIQNRPPAKIS